MAGSSKPTVLMIAYHFPPLGGGGVQRPLTMAKYLSRSGHDVDVVAIGGWPDFPVYDHQIGASLPAAVRVHRTPEWPRIESLMKYPGLSSLLPRPLKKLLESIWSIPERQIAWLVPALIAARRVIRERRPDVLYTTVPPYSTALVGLVLATSYRIAWVLDYRDPWVAKPVVPLHATAVQRRLEELCLKRADHIIVVSDPMAEMLCRLYPRSAPGRISVIPNGYDEEDFLLKHAYKRINPDFRIVHSGALYDFLHPENFIEVLERVRATELPRKPHLYTYGSFTPFTDSLLRQPDRYSRIVTYGGYLPHDRVLTQAQNADLLLLVFGSGRSDWETVASGKIFEYLALGPPILALVGPGAARQLVERSGKGVVVDPTDRKAIFDTLRRIIKGEITFSPPETFNLIQYSRRRQATRLAEILENLR